MNKMIVMAVTFFFSSLIWSQPENFQRNEPLPLYMDIEKSQDASQIPFTAHHGRGKFANYITMQLPYSPIQGVFLQLKKVYPTLKTRGEAHITVLTPLEYHLLKDRLSMQEMDQIAQVEGIQQANFEILGLGSGKTTLQGKEARTYFVIVQSTGLLRIRQKIKEAYERKPDRTPGAFSTHAAFDPIAYYPHITVGFTLRDLHEQDGVIKDMVHSKDPHWTLKGTLKDSATQLN